MSASVTAHINGTASTAIGKMAIKKEKPLNNESERANMTNANKTPIKNFFTHSPPILLIHELVFSFRLIADQIDEHSADEHVHKFPSLFFRRMYVMF